MINTVKSAYRAVVPGAWRKWLNPLRSYVLIFFHNVGCVLGARGAVFVTRGMSHGVRTVRAGKDFIFVVSPKRWNRYLRGINAKCLWLAREYGYERCYTIEPGDVVIDIGANIGELSMFYAKAGARVYSIEADRNVYAPLVLNSRRYSDVQTFNLAIWDENKDLKFFSSVHNADSSGIEPEHFDTVFSQRAIALDCFTDLMGITGVKLIKCDAEGAEPEVLRGAIKTLRRTAYVAFDCGPERNGAPTFAECEDFLTAHGFEIMPRPDGVRQILVARKK